MPAMATAPDPRARSRRSPPTRRRRSRGWRQRSSGSGLACEEISVGATPTARFSLQQDGITELRPGNYIYFDRTQVGARRRDVGRLRPDRPRPRRQPAGRRSDHPGLRQQDALERSGARRFAAAPGSAWCSPISTRRGPTSRCSSSGCRKSTRPCACSERACALKPGDLVRVLPNHACVVSNLVDSVWLVNGDAVLDELPIAARGRIA